MPPGVVDVGLLFTPNFELIRELAPARILTGAGLEAAEPLLRRIAPVAAFPAPEAGAGPFLEAAAAYVALVAAELAAGGAARAPRPAAVCLASPVDARHVTVFGARGLFHDMLTRLAVADAGAGLVPRGEKAVLGIDRLTEIGAARLLLVAAPGEAVPSGPLWRALPAVREGRVTALPAVSQAAGLPGARRLVGLLSQALPGTGPAHG